MFDGKKAATVRALTLSLLASFSIACTAGVKDMDLSDPAIRARVHSQLKSNPEINPRYLNVDCHMGIVTLSGMVESIDQKWAMDRVARRVPGVQQVINNLLVQE